MDQYNEDIKNNIVAITNSRRSDDPDQIDDELFRHHMVNHMFPEYERKHNKRVKYGPYDEIIKQISVPEFCDYTTPKNTKSPK